MATASDASRRQEREASYPQPVVTDYDDHSRLKVVGNGVQVGLDGRGDMRGAATGGAAEKDDGGARRPHTGKKVVELDVSRDQRPPLVPGPREYDGIRGHLQAMVPHADRLAGALTTPTGRRAWEIG